MKTNNPIISAAIAALLILGGCTSTDTEATAALVEGTAAATPDHGQLAVSIKPMAGTSSVLTVMLTVDGTTDYPMNYNENTGAFDSYNSASGIELSAGEHTLVARAYSVACLPTACTPGVNQVGEGTAVVSVVSGQMAAVYMRVLDTSALDPTQPNHVPIITAMVVSTLTVGVNTDIQLQAVAIDPDGELQTAALTYSWTVGACSQAIDSTQTFGSPTERSTTWQSNSIQDCMLVLIVTDGSDNTLIDAILTPMIHVMGSGIQVGAFSAFFVPQPVVQYIVATDGSSTQCAYDRSYYGAMTCAMDFSSLISFEVYVDAGTAGTNLNEIDLVASTSDYCGDANFVLESEMVVPDSTLVRYVYAWAPNRTFNTACTLTFTASHLGMTDTGSITLTDDESITYAAAQDVESANDSTLTVNPIDYAPAAAVGYGALGSDDYYALQINEIGERVILRTGASFADPLGGVDTQIELYDSAPDGTLILLASDDNSGPGSFSELWYDLPGTGELHTYYVRVSVAGGSVGTETDLYSLYFHRSTNLQ